MKGINVKFIHVSEHRFAEIGNCTTCLGDYFETETTIEFRITRMPNPIHSLAILIHELHEKFRNDQLGIADAAVDKFDTEHAELDDAGMSPDAPYHRTHCEADVLERAVIALSGESWAAYEAACDALFATPE